MIIAIIGESCVGKTTLANKIKETQDVTIYTGKDFIKLAKSPTEAKTLFKEMLKQASLDSDKKIIYIITEKEHLELLPKNTFKIVMTEKLDVIKERFKTRMRGILPPPVEKMITDKHGMFDHETCNLKICSNQYDFELLLREIGKH